MGENPNPGQDLDENVESGSFPTTAWSELLRDDRSTGMDYLARRYWKPLYLYVRRALGKSPEEASDLTQEFFLRVCETDLVSKARREPLTFRRFIRSSIRNFVLNAQRDAAAQRRGGGLKRVGIEEAEAQVTRPGDPEQLFDQEWAEAVFEGALERLRAACEREGRTADYELFQAYEIDRLPDSDLTYEGLAERSGLSVSDVRNRLHLARKRWRSFVLHEVRETVSAHSELAAEFQELLGRL
jgi:RNA polymerase sigma-70 factor (ECF subfamily)